METILDVISASFLNSYVEFWSAMCLCMKDSGSEGGCEGTTIFKGTGALIKECFHPLSTAWRSSEVSAVCPDADLLAPSSSGASLRGCKKQMSAGQQSPSLVVLSAALRWTELPAGLGKMHYCKPYPLKQPWNGMLGMPHLTHTLSPNFYAVKGKGLVRHQ